MRRVATRLAFLAALAISCARSCEVASVEGLGDLALGSFVVAGEFADTVALARPEALYLVVEGSRGSLKFVGESGATGVELRLTVKGVGANPAEAAANVRAPTVTRVGDTVRVLLASPVAGTILLPARSAALSVSLTSGSVDFEDVGGRVRVRVDTGRLSGDVIGSLRAFVGRGSATLTFSGDSVAFEGGNADVSLRCKRLSGALTVGVDVGDLRVRLPSTPGAVITARTGNGSVTFRGADASLDKAGLGTVGRALVGDGSARVELDVGRGDVKVEVVETAREGAA